ncbi:MAG TPA: acetyl-CoA carboxylase biotin carboxyl carrier protein subunit [Pyrinomonadaceae bacterium]|nr:acetyl-CoA carboxylase biotin carboxyl carrier protein subunit [Pyrinomonadaceae bacterium]
MKLKAELAGREHALSIEHGSDGLSGQVDDRHYNFEVRDLGAGDYLLQHGTLVYRCRVEASQEADEFTVHVHGKSHVLTLRDPKRLRSAQNDADHGLGSARIIAPMPGKLVRILVEVGTQVEAGAGLLVVEAMKMQNEMKTPKAGTVVSLRTDAGATVNAGDVLAVVE